MWWLPHVNYKASESLLFAQLRSVLTHKGRLLYPGRFIFKAADYSPDAIALVSDNLSFTYAQFFTLIQTFRKTLELRGIKPGDRIIICLENSLEFFVAYYAIWHCGAVVVPLNTFLKDNELQHIIVDAKPALIITHQDRVADFGNQLDLIITADQIPSVVPEIISPIVDDIIEIPEDEMAALLYTSGTTGLPKGVMLSSKNIITNLMQGMARLRLVQSERILAILPLFHSFAQYACVWASFFATCTVIIVRKIERRALIAGLAHKPTIFIGVPALFGLLAMLKTAPLDSVRLFVSGGDAMPDKIRMYFNLLYRRRICIGYGLTETTPLIAVDFDDMLMPTSCTGRPVMGIQCEIRAEDGHVRGLNKMGRLWVRGDNVMMGYYNEPAETAKVLVDGWFDTGDLAYLDDLGKIVITGRLKDLMSNKGFKIYPQEIENVVMTHPNVMRVGVVGRSDGMGNQDPIAFVQVRKEHDTMAQELKKLCVQHLATYKIPKEFICSVDELPLTATAKVDKKVLRKKLTGD